jgi:Obg family GTPase CgtA
MCGRVPLAQALRPVRAASAAAASAAAAAAAAAPPRGGAARCLHADTRHKFVDRIRLEVVGGAGGKGIISFESLDNVKQRPIGGNGGAGGNVVIEAAQTVRDLNFQTYVIRGHDGTMAVGKGNNGKAGRVKRIMVPVGTVLKEVRRTYEYGGGGAAHGGGGDDDYAYVPADVLAAHATAAAAAGGGAAAAGEEDGDGAVDDDAGRRAAAQPLRRLLLDDDDGEGDGDDGGGGGGGGRVGRGRGARGAARRRGASAAAAEQRGGDDAADGDEDHDSDGDSDGADGGGWQRVAPALPPAAGTHGGGGPRAAAQRPAPAPAPPASSSREVRKVNKAGLAYRESVHVLADLDAHGAVFLAARGGQPGAGNKGSALNYAEQVRSAGSAHVAGSRGETRFLELELKSIADVGLVGFPNAGKSSLLGALSKAKPRVAAYPFTTLHPTVGVLNYGDGGTLTVADIPGLIEGAHLDRGLGHEFLRHIERTRVLLFVVDACGDGGGSGDPARDLRALQHELRMYDPALPRRPSLVVANKCDLPRGRAGAAALRAATSLPVLEASALTRAGAAGVANALRWLLEARARLEGAGGGGGA